MDFTQIPLKVKTLNDLVSSCFINYRSFNVTILSREVCTQNSLVVNPCWG